MQPEKIDPTVIVPFLEKVKADAEPKYLQSTPATEIIKDEEGTIIALQFKFQADGLAFVATGIETATTGDYQLNWARIRDICDRLIRKQNEAPRDYTYLGQLYNQQGKPDVEFLLLASYETQEIGPQRRIGGPGRTEGEATEGDLGCCAGKRKLMKRDDPCLRLPHTSWFIRWRHTGAMVGYTYLAATVFQAWHQLIADDRGVPMTEYQAFLAGLGGVPVAGNLANIFFEVVATTGNRIARDILISMIWEMVKLTKDQGWAQATSDKVVAAISSEIIDQAGQVIAQWSWGQRILPTGQVVAQPDGSTGVATIVRHDELRR